MKTKSKILVILIFVAALFAIFAALASKSKTDETVMKEVHPLRGDISSYVSTTGTVEPMNRLELKPTVSGRLEKVLVQEGDTVHEGQVLAWMSSAERASLIDAARLKGEIAVKYWEEVYRPAPIISPIDGTIIVRSLEPGQSVTSSTAVLVISDKLVVKATVDETDIGKVSLGQKAAVSLDSHPEITVGGEVSHISFESTVVNNVTVYYVRIVLDEIPAVFRSGMSANINIAEKTVKDALLLRTEAVSGSDGGKYVLVKKGKDAPPEKRRVETGISRDGLTEIVSGLNDSDTVLIAEKKTAPASESSKSTNPFLPTPPKNGKKDSGAPGPDGGGPK